VTTRPVPELQAVTPEQLHRLLRDLFDVTTTWHLGTEYASAEPLDAGTWWVTLDVHAHEFVTDAAGGETDVPMDDFVEGGVFDVRDAVRPVHRSLERVDPTTHQLTVVVPLRPVCAGIEPRLLLDLDGDNTVNVQGRPSLSPRCFLNGER